MRLKDPLLEPAWLNDPLLEPRSTSSSCIVKAAFRVLFLRFVAKDTRTPGDSEVRRGREKKEERREGGERERRREGGREGGRESEREMQIRGGGVNALRIENGSNNREM